MSKRDLKKELKSFYQPRQSKVVTVDVPRFSFLMIDGKGDPNTAIEYKQAVEALFSLSYTLKFIVKKGLLGIDYGVMPLEGLWWAEDMENFENIPKDDWFWTAMIMQPEMISQELVTEATENLKKKKELPALEKVRFEAFEEGRVAQTLHIGPFSEEGPTIRKVHEYIEEMGFAPNGKHHEIYLSDIRRAAPEKWKTIIRQPY
ncbi:GyrI-like domain-containing protein [Flavobacteriaceae bacterium D16]|nr:GyrI-like domain-containing protein [Flavobacteriaceae bacterium D16]